MWTIFLDMMPVFLEACLCMAVGSFATVTGVGRSTCTLVILKVTQVVCDVVALTTATSEEGLCDVLEVITQTSGFVAVCFRSAYADVRTN